MIPLKAPQNECLGLFAQELPFLFRELDFFVKNVIIDPLDIFAIEGRLARQKLVGDNAETPYVDLLGVLLVADQLWRHVERSAEHETKS